MENYLSLHEKALTLSKQYRRVEAELIDVLQKLKKEMGFLKLGYTGAFEYLTRALGFSPDQAYNFKRVADKCEEVPELKTAIAAQTLNVSTARRVVAVMNRCNANSWISKAATLSQRELEREIAGVNPKALLPERTRAVTSELVENRYLATYEEEAIVKRVIDLECQRQRRVVTRQEAILVMAKLYLMKNDPLEKAKRAHMRSKNWGLGDEASSP